MGKNNCVQEENQSSRGIIMKLITGFLTFLCTILILTCTIFYLTNKGLDINLSDLKKQNDSLYSVISKNDNMIDSLNKSTLLLFQKNDSLKQSLVLINKKAENYKKQHEKDVNYINNLSNNDIVELFTNKFTY